MFRWEQYLSRLYCSAKIKEYMMPNNKNIKLSSSWLPRVEIEFEHELDKVFSSIEPEKNISLPHDTKIIKNGRALILWNKRMNKKVIVKRCKSDADDVEKALALALLKWHEITSRDMKRLIKKVEIQ